MTDSAKPHENRSRFVRAVDQVLRMLNGETKQLRKNSS